MPSKTQTTPILSSISHIEYEPQDPSAFEEALKDGGTEVFVCLKNGTRINVSKPVRFQKDDDNFVYLKIPNPCNHQPVIAYIEACVARLAQTLLLCRGVLVPEYAVIELSLNSADGSKTPACLIEALETFTPFGLLGDDFVADPSKVRIENFSAEQRQERLRRLSLLFCKEFAAYAVVTQFIGNNDPHQENFGSVNLDGDAILAAIDFDMAPMPFLTHHEVFGPYNAETFTIENLYHDDIGGRHTPESIDFSQFPISPHSDGRATPDNWFTNWCSGFTAGLKASTKNDEFRLEANRMFSELAQLPELFFTRTFEKVITKKIQAAYPELSDLLADLTTYFQGCTAKLKQVVERQKGLIELHAPAAPPFFNELSETDSFCLSPLARLSFYKGLKPAHKPGTSPEMEQISSRD